jgi:hypothetical protein
VRGITFETTPRQQGSQKSANKTERAQNTVQQGDVDANGFMGPDFTRQQKRNEAAFRRTK